MVALQRLITLLHQSPQSDTTYAFFTTFTLATSHAFCNLLLFPTVQGRVSLTRSTQKRKSASWPLCWAPPPDLNISSAAVLSGDSLVSVCPNHSPPSDLNHPLLTYAPRFPTSHNLLLPIFFFYFLLF